MKLFFVLAIVLICKFVQPSPFWVYQDEKLEQDPIPDTNVQEDPFYSPGGSWGRPAKQAAQACRQCHQQYYHHYPGKKDEDTENDPMANTEGDEENIQEDPFYSPGGSWGNRLPCCKLKKPKCRQCHRHYHRQCMNPRTFYIGSSHGNSKTKYVASGYTCPKSVDKNNWVGRARYNDKFKIIQQGTQIRVQRTDSRGGWGMHLQIRCCKAHRSHHGWKKDEDTENDPMANTEGDEENVQEDPFYSPGGSWGNHANRLPCC